VEAFHRTDRVTWSAANFVAAVDNSYSVARSCSACVQSRADCRLMVVDSMNLAELDCDCMDGRYSASCTSAGSGAVADNDDVMIELVAKAVRE
jgi:hypothetical protein